MTKRVQCDPEFCCGQWHDWPDKVPCPKCGSIEDVAVWEAWGHPNGQLVCWECSGMNSDAMSLDDYWTWRMENGQPVIIKWETVEA